MNDQPMDTYDDIEFGAIFHTLADAHGVDRDALRMLYARIDDGLTTPNGDGDLATAYAAGLWDATPSDACSAPRIADAMHDGDQNIAAYWLGRVHGAFD